MRIITYFLLFTIAFLLINCSGTKISTNTKDLKNSKYFRILADADDDPIFIKLQDDLGIDPKMERYTIIVDVRAYETSLQFLMFGDEYNSIRFNWSQLSKQVRNGLLNWTGSNKERLD